jgi:hypothetical protein
VIESSKDVRHGQEVKKQAQEAGDREREREGGGACIDCLLACSGRKKRRFMLASSTVS